MFPEGYFPGGYFPEGYFPGAESAPVGGGAYFPRGFFPSGYFAPTYFPNEGGGTPPLTTGRYNVPSFLSIPTESFVSIGE